MTTLVAEVKRPRSSGSLYTTRHVRKRLGISGHCEEYTEEEKHIILGLAAEVLGTSVQDLKDRPVPSPTIAATDDEAYPSTDESITLDGMESFELKMPQCTRRSRLPCGQDFLSVPLKPEVSGAGSGPKSAIEPWLSDCSMLGENAGLFFPSEESFVSDQPCLDGLERGVYENPTIWLDLDFDTLLPDNTALPGVVDHGETPRLSISNDVPLPFPCDRMFHDHFPSSRSEAAATPNSVGESIDANGAEFQSNPQLSQNNTRKGRRTGTTAKRRGPLAPQARQETWDTRKAKACMRCSMQRIKCLQDPKDPSGSCLSCKKVAGNTLSRLPCLRYKIPDAQLLDHEVRPRLSWSCRWKKMDIIDIKDWRSPETKIIHVTQDIGGAKYRLEVKEFVPINGDALERRWMKNGTQQSFKCTPYAIADMKAAGHDLIRYADKHLGAAICHYVDETDSLLRDTYAMARRYSHYAEGEEERDLLRHVLRLWCASRMESHSDRICGKETLDMQAWDFGPDSPNSGHILLPPVLSAQMEVIVTAMILLPMKRAVLVGLEKLFKANKRENWFTIYLTMFILLHSCALLTDADNKRARKQGMQSRFFNAPVIKELHNGANILLAHFHYCNKGNHPFSADWTSPEIIERARMDTEQADFMRSTAEQIDKKEPIFKKVREEKNVEHELFFLAQLYDRDWKPS